MVRGDESGTGKVFPWISLVARAILGGALLIAGLMKITDLEASVLAVKAYDFGLSASMTSFIGHTQPIVEILVGTVILAGVLTRWTGLVGALAMVVFIAGIISAWARGLSIDCGCFTPGGLLAPGQATAYMQDILRDTGFLICGVWLVLFPRSRFSIDAWMKEGAPDG